MSTPSVLRWSAVTFTEAPIRRWSGVIFTPTFPGSNGSGGRIWIATRNPGGGWDSALWLDNFDPSLLISSFGEDETGELYFTDLSSDVIYRVVTP